MTAARHRHRSIAWVAVLAAAIGLLAVAAFDGGGTETDADRIERLYDSFACPLCNGQSVAESNAGVSVTIRQYIADEVAAGATDAEIRDQLVRSYPGILLTPPAEGFGSLVWVLPVVVFAGGAAVIATVLTRGRDQPSTTISSGDRELVAKARQARQQ